MADMDISNSLRADGPTSCVTAETKLQYYVPFCSTRSVHTDTFFKTMQISYCIHPWPTFYRYAKILVAR